MSRSTSVDKKELLSLRAKVAELEALYAASEIERQKLAELVELLNARHVIFYVVNFQIKVASVF